MKVSSKLFVGAGVLGLALAATIGSTFAWFSMNTNVTVSGMTVTAKTTDNIMISTNNGSDANYSIGLNQELSAILEPASTINGYNFYYHSTASGIDGNGLGSNEYIAYNEAGSLDNSNAGKTNYDLDFNRNYKITGDISVSNVVYGYVDYSYYLKATNAADSAQNLSMTTCNLTYQGNVITDKAWRAAMFAFPTVKETNTANSVITADDTYLKTILRKDDASYFTPNKAVAPEYEDGHEGDPAYTLANSETINTVAKLDNPTIIGSVDAQSTSYYKVIIRLWLEGEDTTCKIDTYAQLTQDYNLDLNFAFHASGINYLSSHVTATASGEGTTTGTATLSIGEHAVGYQWYDASTGLAIEGATAETYTPGSVRTVYCVITTMRGSQYRTNSISLTAE